MSRLDILQTASFLYNTDWDVCENCCKDQSQLRDGQEILVCSRCKEVSYCCASCQHADWQKHKKVCHGQGSGSELVSRWESLKFVVVFYFPVVRKIVEKMRETGLKKSELLLELDFMKIDGCNEVPTALRGEFKIAPIKGYTEVEHMPLYVRKAAVL